MRNDMGKGWLEVAWAIRRVGDRVGVSQSKKQVLEGNDPHRGHGPLCGSFLYSDLPLPRHPPS